MLWACCTQIWSYAMHTNTCDFPETYSDLPFRAGSPSAYHVLLHHVFGRTPLLHQVCLAYIVSPAVSLLIFPFVSPTLTSGFCLYSPFPPCGCFVFLNVGGGLGGAQARYLESLES